MSKTSFRPSGHLDWVLDRCPSIEWTFLGCLGTERRSLAALQRILARKKPSQTWLLKIMDKPSRHSNLVQSRLDERLAQLISFKGDPAWVREHSLLESHSDIVAVAEEVFASSTNVILDITSLPKRFFFPLLRLFLLNSDRVHNLMLTYSVAKEYASEKLAENFNDWDHLPLFSGQHTHTRTSMLVVGVGFEILGLQERIEHGEDGLPIKLLVPYPARSTAFLRSLEVVRQVQKYRNPEVFDLYLTDPTDVSDVFDRILTLTESGAKRAEFAPFGPKPISAGICLYATLTNSEVFFNQPTVYHPDYSVSVSERNGHPDIFGYVVRLQRREYYTI